MPEMLKIRLVFTQCGYLDVRTYGSQADDLDVRIIREYLREEVFREEVPADKYGREVLGVAEHVLG